MGTTNLYDQEAQKKVKEMAESIDFAMLATNFQAPPLHIIPMSTKEVDEDGNIWFLSSKLNEHSEHIRRDGVAQLIYSKPSSMKFLTVYGLATISTEKYRLASLYESGDDAWFEGVDDPNLIAICIDPKEAHYWDPKSNMIVTLFKMALGAVTGDEPDLLDTGKLKY